MTITTKTGKNLTLKADGKRITRQTADSAIKALANEDNVVIDNGSMIFTGSFDHSKNHFIFTDQFGKLYRFIHPNKVLNSIPYVKPDAQVNVIPALKVTTIKSRDMIIDSAQVTVEQAIAIIDRLNYRHCTFEYRHTTNDDIAEYRHFDAYRDGDKDAFAITEVVIDGVLDSVRFYNLFRNIRVDLHIAPTEDAIRNQAAHDLRTYHDFDSFTVDDCFEMTNDIINDLESVHCKLNRLKLDDNPSLETIDEIARLKRYCKIRDAECDLLKEKIGSMSGGATGDRDDVFSLLPELDELNDIAETDPWLIDDDGEYTDRDARFNRGEKIAAELTAKLRAFDPTVEVTFGIDDEDDEDYFFLKYDGLYGARYTATGVEPSFHALKQYDKEIAAETKPTPEVIHQFAVPRDELKDFIDSCHTRAAAANVTINDITTDQIAGDPFLVDVYLSGTRGGVEQFIQSMTGNLATDDFANEIARLQADVEHAKSDRQRKQAALLKAQEAHETAIKAESKAEARLQEFGQGKAQELNARLIDSTIVRARIALYSADGMELSTDPSQLDIDFYDGQFKITSCFERLGFYDTPAQVETAIEQLKAAIERGDKEFTFPTFEKLNRAA